MLATIDWPLWRLTVQHPDATPPHGIEHIEVRAPTELGAVALVQTLRPSHTVVAVARQIRVAG